MWGEDEDNVQEDNPHITKNTKKIMKKFYKPYKLKNRYHDGEVEKDADFEEIGQENIDRTMQSLQERC